MAQGTYPLQRGNLWQYWSWDYQNGQVSWTYGWTDRIVGDTIMPNGKNYALFQSDGAGSYGWLNGSAVRQESSKVLIYVPRNQSDSVLYDFSKSAGDTLWIVARPHDTVLVTIWYDHIGNVFGNPCRQWGYCREVRPSTLYLLMEISDGFGNTYQEAEAGDIWHLRGAIINAVSYGVISNVSERRTPVAEEAFLAQNYPNPFNSSTIIELVLQKIDHVTLAIHDVLGRELIRLIDTRLDRGTHKLQWDGKDKSGRSVPSGVYFCSVTIGGFRRSRLMNLVR